MRILLPPSETKRLGGGGSFVSDSLLFHTELADARARVRKALEQVSSGELAAAKALKLGKTNLSERYLNLELDASGVMPAIERYTGVLYEALDVTSLSDAARQWMNAHVFIQSALFGLVSASDQIPAYRVSASSRLPTLSGTLKSVWQPAHEQLDWTRFGFILDLRSQDYVQLAPVPRGQGWYLRVVQRTDSGEVRALNHFNKAAKGHFVHKLAQAQVAVETAEELCEWANQNGFETTIDPVSHDITLITELGVPQKSVRSTAR